MIAAPLGPLAVIAGPGWARARRWRPGSSGWWPTAWSARPRARPDLHPQGGGRAGRAGPLPAGAASPRGPGGHGDPGGDATRDEPVRRGSGDRHLPRLRRAAGRRQRPARGARAVHAADHARGVLAAGRQIVAAYDGPMDEIIWTPQSVTAAVLELAGDLAEHLREPDDVTARWAAGSQRRARRAAGPDHRRPSGKYSHPNGLGNSCSRWSAVRARPRRRARSSTTGTRWRWLRGSPQATRRSGAAERARYQVVLLDEYQDTSHAQLVLLRSLFGGGHPVTAVGDPCQSIYGWRGASAGNLRRFTADFPVMARTRPFGASAHRPAPVCCCRPASATPRGSSTPPRPSRRSCARGARRAPAGARAGPGERGAVAVRPAGHRARMRPTGWPARSRRAADARPRARRAGRLPWPDAATGRCPPGDIAVVPQAVPVPAAREAFEARGSRSRWSGSAACCGARGGRRGGHAAGPARRRRLGRTGPAAHRRRAGGSVRATWLPWPPRPRPGPWRGRPAGAGRPNPAEQA